MNELEERVTELEIRLSYQTRMIEELDQAVIDCHDRVAALEKDNQRMRQLLQAMEPEHKESPDE